MTKTCVLATLVVVVVIVVAGCAQAPALTSSVLPQTARPTATSMRTSSVQTLPSIPVRTLSLQVGNNNPRIRLSPDISRNLPDNRIGVHTEGIDRYSDTTHVYENGFKWIRIQSLTDFWGQNDGLLTFWLDSIPQEVDDYIDDYIRNDVNIVLDLWMGAGLAPYGTTFQSPDEIATYLDYVSFVVSHFEGRIPYYQIWNEPGDIAVSDYANLVRKTVPVIRQADPDARIIIGGTQGNWEDGYSGYDVYQRFSLDMVYLDQLLRSGVVDDVDGISWHPFYDNIPEDPYYQDYANMVQQQIKDVAESEGFTGEYFADELLWRTVTEEGWAGGPPLSPEIAAKYYVRAIVMHRGLGTNVTINTFFQQDYMEPIHNICDTMAGAKPTNLTLTLETQAANVVYYSFVLPDGSKLVALWTNDGAVEEDPGVPVNLTVMGTRVNNVVGVDVYNGVEQELNFYTTRGGNLRIAGLLVRDYPIILHLTN